MGSRSYPREIDKYTRSDHFEERMEERNISEKMILDCVSDGSISFAGEEGDVKFQLEQGGIRIVVVAFGRSESQNAVLSTVWLELVNRQEAIEYWGIETALQAKHL